MDTDWYSEDMATFGDRLAAARENAGLSAESLAGRLGVKPNVLEAWEDDLKAPRANRLQMLSGMLNVSLSWLLTGEGEGVGVPEDDISRTDPDVAALFTELRALRVEMMANTERLALLERRIRKAVTTS